MSLKFSHVSIITNNRVRFLPACVALFIGLATIEARAAISYSVPESIYSQDFDSLPNSPTNTSLGSSPNGWKNDDPAPGAGNFSIIGWYLLHPLNATEGGFNGNQRLRAGSGNSATGSFL